MAEQLLVNGTDILACAELFTPDLSKIHSTPARRTGNVVVPGKHGAVVVPRKLYAPLVIPLTLWVIGRNADGSWPSDPTSQFQQNLDSLLLTLQGTVTLTHVLSGSGGSRSITGEVLDVIDFTRYAWAANASVGVSIVCSDPPFWRDLSAVTSTMSVTGTTAANHACTEFAGATAPSEDPVIVFSNTSGAVTNPKLSSSDGTWHVEYDDSLTAGQSVTIDCGAWTLTGGGGLVPDYSKLVHAGIGPWFIMQPVAGGPVVSLHNNGSGTLGCTVTAKRAYLGA